MPGRLEILLAAPLGNTATVALVFPVTSTQVFVQGWIQNSVCGGPSPTWGGTGVSNADVAVKNGLTSQHNFVADIFFSEIGGSLGPRDPPIPSHQFLQLIN